jgi:hypothetical protein
MAVIDRPAREVPIQGGDLPLILLPTNCPGCGIGLDREKMRAQN